MSNLLLETIFIGAGTYLLRAGSLSWGSRVKWPVWAQRWLTFVTPAILGALLGPLLLLPNNQWLPPLHNPALLSAVPTVLTGWWSRNILLTIAVGVVCYSVLLHLH